MSISSGAISNARRCSAQEFDHLIFSDDTLRLPCLAADPELKITLQQFADRAPPVRANIEKPFVVAVENKLRLTLPRGDFSIETVATTLGVSDRTLIRRLSEEGTTFSEVLDNLRRTLALQHLWNSKFSVSQIGLLLGYSGIAPFSDAFRRWTGAPPSSFRDRPERLHEMRANAQTG